MLASIDAQYKVYGKNITELAEKTAKKQKELQEQREIRTNPSISTYYEYFTDIRRNQVKENSIRTQKILFTMISDTEIKLGFNFGELKIKDITRKDIEQIRQYLLSNSNKAMCRQ